VFEPAPHEDHRCQAVIEVSSGYVLVCTCGWRTPAAPTAATVGAHWDAHRAA
jgi:hypothetical protein